tara:strand:- start:226 stop:1023 length:798 start_codon:yes stop_codon:yes gene_type:complete
VYKVGVFDSGIGGMKIATSILESIPSCDVFYYADQAHAPYGNLNEKQIDSRCYHITEKFLEEGVDLIVIACNTATSTSIKKLRENFNVPFVGVEPDLNYFNRNIVPDSAKIGVLTTPITQKMDKFNDLKAKLDPHNFFQYISMPLLASLVEKIFLAEKDDILKIKNEIKSDLNLRVPEDLDYLVLGCTHYGLIDLFISECLNVKTICPSSSVVKQVNRQLELDKFDVTMTRSANEIRFCSSKKIDGFKKIDLEWKQRFKSEKLMS